MTLRERVRRIWKRHPEHPFAALWAWAKRGKTKRARRRRFRALQGWAWDRYTLYKKNGWPNPWRFLKAWRVYRRKVKWLNEHIDPKPAPSGAGTVTFDGRPVAKWIAAILQEARNDGVYFQVISGYRSPEYSTSLCYAMCGAPQCPGRCAGAASNHACPPTHACSDGEGAVDVSPGYAALEAWCRRKGKPLYGGGYRLSGDLPHFSRSGV